MPEKDERIEDLENPIQNLYRPIDELAFISRKFNLDLLDEEFSLKLDQSCLFPTYRKKFHYPKLKSLPGVCLKTDDYELNPEFDCIYFCGHSLGLQPIETRNKIEAVLDKWAKMGVDGHFEGTDPWTKMEDEYKPTMAHLVGAKVDEIAIMNSLTVNLQLLLVSFYQPTEDRFKILIEEKAFPSDYYVVESQVRLHNLDPKIAIISLKPRQNESILRAEDITEAIDQQGHQIALVLFSGVHYYTGQMLNMEKITRLAHRKGCFVGFDLAHAVGNVELELHNWNIDFAAWCTYKYLNSGPGGIGAIFFHEKHFNSKTMKKLDGWWGHKLETRFQMKNKMEYSHGASKYALSTSPSILLNCLSSSLQLFEEAGFRNVLRKSKLLTSYLEYLLNEKIKCVYAFEQITPTDPNERGSHISIRFLCNVEKVFACLQQRGVVCDFRSPDAIRIAPVALYNTFNEVYRFVDILDKCLAKF